MSVSSYRRAFLLAVPLAGLGAFLFLLDCQALMSSGAPKCDRWAATNGSNSNAGTSQRPVRTADVLVKRLKRRQTGCFRSGVYDFSEISLRRPRITLSSAPGESATLRGRIRIERSATRATIENLVLDGRNPGNLLGPLIYADYAKLVNNDISNDHMGICILVDSYRKSRPPSRVVIKDNKIHDCGRLPRTNRDHGIYLGHSLRATIRGNWIFGNADRGIQLYPNARRTVITRNVLEANGQGVSFGGLKHASSRNVVKKNVISNSLARFNVESFWGGSPGKRNLVNGNCLWTPGAGEYSGKPQNSGVALAQRGFNVSNSTVVAPDFIDGGRGDLRLALDSRCAKAVGWTNAGALNAGSAPAG